MKIFYNATFWFWKEFLYGGHIQCLGALSVVFLTSLLFKSSLTWDIFLVTYLTFYPIYIYNRTREASVDFVTNPQRTEHVKKSMRILRILFWVCLLGAFGLFVRFSEPWGILFGAGIFLFGILYTEFFKKRTEHIPGLKNFYVALVFALLVFFPNLYYGSTFSSLFLKGAGVLALFIFFKGVVWQIFLDVKDIESDTQQNLRTFPILLGREKILRLLPFLGLIATMPVFFLPRQFLSLFFVLPFNWYTYSLGKRGSYNGYTLASFEMLLWSLLVLLV